MLSVPRGTGIPFASIMYRTEASSTASCLGRLDFAYPSQYIPWNHIRRPSILMHHLHESECPAQIPVTYGIEYCASSRTNPIRTHAMVFEPLYRYDSGDGRPGDTGRTGSAAGTVEAQGQDDDNPSTTLRTSLYPCSQPRTIRGSQPRGWAVRRSFLCRPA